MEKLLNVSSSPHVRSPLTTGEVMYDVILALMPATFFGVYHFGTHALLIILTSIVSACLTEFVFDYVCHRPNTLTDGSAVLTGLLLGLCLSPTVPLYIPYLGSLFAILVVKCFFGGLGANFMNPALAGRCFLLISFGTVMTDFGIDGISSATPLAVMSNGGTVNVLDMFLGFTSGTIGVSCVAMLMGAIYLLIAGDITWHIPVSYIGTFLILMAIGSGQGFNPLYLVAQLCGGGLLLGALFMATDPVTSPVTSAGQLFYGVTIGILTALFRLYGSSTESVSYAIILGNLVTPLIDKWVIPKPFGLGDNAKTPKPRIPHAAVVLTAVTLISGIALGGVNFLTRDTIEAQKLAANAAAYQAVVADADSFRLSDAADDFIKEYGSEVYGNGTWGKIYIREAVEALDASGNVMGYAVSLTTGDGFDGNITLTVGLSADGTVNGISFTELNETAGMGMRVDEDEWKAQFAGVNTDSFTLNKAGGSTAENEIDSVSGASTTSGAVVNAVNAAIDFVNHHMK